jgi:hypothetical protein
MNYTYKIINDQIVLRIEDQTFITRVDGNSLHDEYLKWIEEGNEPLPPDPIPEPEPLTAQQKLEAAGLTIEELKEILGL